MITNKIHVFASKITPDPMEVDYWIDTVADPYGSVIKYYKNGEWLQLLTGDGSGTTDYNALDNKPKINGVVIEGNVDGAALGITNAYTKTETNNAISTAIDEIPEATQEKAGLMSAEDKYKLDGLTGAYLQIITLTEYNARYAVGTLDANTVYHIKG